MTTAPDSFVAKPSVPILLLVNSPSTSRRRAPAGPRVLIIVQNLPVPFDRRVWFEAHALLDAGFRVSIVAPKGPEQPAYEVLDGVVIRRYDPPRPSRGVVSYAWEFAYCWLRTAVAVVRASLREGFDAIQACNPPDTYWVLAAPFKLAGKRFVFDQHDLCPEVYESRFRDGSPLALRALRWLERGSYAVADHVIVTNESYRRIALERGRLEPDGVTVVRNGPDPQRLRRGAPKPEWRAGRKYLCAYLGVMGPQDGVDLVLEVLAALLRRGIDVHFVLMGRGDSFDEVVALAERLGVSDRVTFTGWADDETIIEVLSTADVGLCPDPLNPLNDVSTMNKTMEYMAFELPIVSFELTETVVSAGPSAVYVKPNDTEAFAEAIVELLDDEERRTAMGKAGRERIEKELAWEHQAQRYVGVYERLFGRNGRSTEAGSPADPARPPQS